MIIYALSSASGRAGVAVYRFSGDGVLALVQKLGCPENPPPRNAHYVTLTDPENNTHIDSGLMLYFSAPHSFTGEDVVELQLHGSPAVHAQLMAVLATFPECRPAEQGEFTRRAFSNGKMDLLQAEGIIDLIEADTASQKQQAERQLRGELSECFDEWRESLLDVMALMEACLDFPDEDIPSHVVDESREQLTQLAKAMDAALQDDAIGERIREGFSVVIMGPPNAGKSSLLNWMAKRDAAIVTEIEGTTRDVIEVPINICGFRVNLKDTAGLRESVDVVEQIGVERARAAIADADLCIAMRACDDASTNFDALKTPEGVPVIYVENKSDLTDVERADETGILSISVLKGSGMNALLARIEKELSLRMPKGSPPIITRVRHRQIIQSAKEALMMALEETEPELKCEMLRHAAEMIGGLTGHIHVEEVLDRVFGQFCIGK